MNSNETCNDIELSNGCSMPAIGLASEGEHDEVLKAVKYAIEVGYRHFDCAWFNGNESAVGTAIQEAIKDGRVSREQLFITTKLWNNFHAKKKVMPSIKESLATLKLHYVDVYYIHWPFGFKERSSLWPDDEGSKAYCDVDYVETWEGMEECARAGLAKGLGLCNFNKEQISRVYENSTIKPVILQIEVTPNLNQNELITFCHALDIMVVACHPFGKKETTRFPESPVVDKNLQTIARNYLKSSAQVILKYLLTRGIAVVVKAHEKAKILENIKLFDFTLDTKDIEYLDSCNKNLRTVVAHEFKKHPYYPFYDEGI